MQDSIVKDKNIKSVLGVNFDGQSAFKIYAKEENDSTTYGLKYFSCLKVPKNSNVVFGGKHDFLLFIQKCINVYSSCAPLQANHEVCIESKRSLFKEGGQLEVDNFEKEYFYMARRNKKGKILWSIYITKEHQKYLIEEFEKLAEAIS